MKKIIVLSITFFYFGLCSAQTINFEEYDSTPLLTDSRNGDLAFGDIDNDGDPDLLVLGQVGFSPKTTLYQNNGTGLFTEIVGTPFSDLSFGNVDFADVDNDGDQDVLIIGKSNLTPFFANLYLNDGSGNYSLDATTPFIGTNGYFSFSDVDNDGDLDVLMSGSINDPFFNPIPNTALYLNDGNGGFTEDTGLAIENLQFGALEFVDINNDNNEDVIITGEDTNGVVKNQIYTNDGSGNFNLLSTNTFAVTSSADIAVGDADNDGDQDVLINGRSVTTINRLTKLYMNNGSGSFTELSGTPFIPSDLGELNFADFDNDGDQDILIVGDLPGNFIHAADIYENQGSGNFVLAQELVGGYIAEADIADVNGDNFLDIAIVSIAQEASSNTFKPRTYLNMSAEVMASISSNATLCEGEVLLLDAQPNGASNYEFFLDINLNGVNDPGETVQTGPSNTYTSIANATAVYGVVVTNSFGNSGTAVTTVDVSPLPIADIISNGPQCEGDQIILSAIPSNAANYLFFLDSNGNGLPDTGETLQSGVNQFYFSSNLQNGSTVGVMVTNSSLCTDIALTTIEVINNPNATIVNNSPQCAGEQIIFNAGPTGNTDYQFFLDANNNGSLDAGELLQIGALNTFTSNTLNDGDVIGVVVFNAVNCFATATTSVTIIPATDPLCFVCPPDYVDGGNGALSGIVNGIADYETDGAIESTQTIVQNAQVDYDSGIEIELKSGFEIMIGAELDCFIDGCNNGGGGNN